METLIQTAGWIGTALIITAYFLVSTKKLGGESRLYQVMNLVGAIGVGANVFHQSAWPALALQVVWGLIAIFAIGKSLMKSESTGV